MSMRPIANQCPWCSTLYNSNCKDLGGIKCPACHPSVTLSEQPEYEGQPHADERWNTMSFMPVAAGIVIMDDKIVVAQRNDHHGRIWGRWENSGGGVEPGETFREAVVRELKEELCIESRIEHYICQTFVYKGHKATSVVIQHYLCTVVAGAPVVGDPRETKEIKLVTLDEFNELTLMPGMTGCKDQLVKAIQDHMSGNFPGDAGGDRGL